MEPTGIALIIGVIMGIVVGHLTTLWWQVEPLRQERNTLSHLCAYWQGEALELQNRRVRVKGDKEPIEAQP